MDVIKTMDRLSNAQGVTGFEHAGITQEVCALFRETAEGLENVRVRSDVSGSAFVTVGSGSPHVLVMAHLDEVAMIVMGIEKNGMLRVASAAGADPKVLPGSRVRVYGRRELTGIVGAIPPHLTASKSAAYKWDHLLSRAVRQGHRPALREGKRARPRRRPRHLLPRGSAGAQKRLHLLKDLGRPRPRFSGASLP